jgi:SAM-dependent methyltransferase
VTGSVQTPAPGYSFDNDDPEAVDRHGYLAAMLDPFTFARLSGLGDLAGRRCLELGAGGGSVARWLADQVGSTGRVLATDLNPRHMPDDTGYTVLRHNLVTDPVPDSGEWDVIHARMVMLHIPEREEILPRLADALAPGGALVIEDWATGLGDALVLNAPSEADAELVQSYHDTLMGLVRKNGNDPLWATRTHAAMLRAGLSDVDTAIEARSWPGGTAGAMLFRANMAQLREEFVAAGFSAERMERLAALVADPRLVIRGHYMFSTIGRRPGP